MAEYFDIIVVGAGLVGSAFALDVAQKSSLKVALIERAPALNAVDGESNQRVVALGPLAIDTLKSVGVFQQLSAHCAHAYHSMVVWDERSDGELRFDAEELELAELGFMVDAVACTHALQAKALSADNANLSCFFDTEVTQLEWQNEQAVLHCEHGTFHAGLIVGADGARSWLRSQAKIFAHRRNYNQMGIVAKIKTSESHQNCAWQRFLHSGPVAALPVCDNQSSIVWSVDHARAQALMQMNGAAFATVLTQAFEQRLGEVVDVGPRQMFPLVSQKAATYISKSLALIGDAAHSIHPLAGQGANLGFKDAVCLKELIVQTPKEQLGSLPILAQYEKKRQPDNVQTDWLMSALNAAYQHDSPLWLSARGAGMNWLNQRRHIKTLLARHAMGL